MHCNARLKRGLKMKTPNVIGMCGPIGAGKDSICSILMLQHGYKQVSFAEPLKDVLSVLFGWDREALEGKTKASREWRDTVDEYWSSVLGFKLTPRIALQQVGTNLFRNHFHQDIWVKSIQKRVQTKYKDEKVIFSDCRFKNEIQIVQSLGGTIIEVQGKEVPLYYDLAVKINSSTDDIEKNKLINEMNKLHNIHPSEYEWIGIHRDILIKNNKTLLDLQNTVQSLFQ